MATTTREATAIVKEYYQDYAKYVLETRALPSIYDGMKHVHRRVIYEANKLPMKLTKSANLIGNTIPLHPHSTDSIYGALVGMTTPVSSFRLFKGKGNFGGYGFGSAAFRYTEAYLDDHARFCYTQFMDYTEFEIGETGNKEPFALPALIPYSSVIGTSGIGVGLSTNIMPLNLMDLIDYFLDIINEVDEPRVPKPDLGNLIIDMDDKAIDDAVFSSSGQLVVRSVITQEGSNLLVIDELFNKSPESIERKLKDYIDKGKVDFRDESSGTMRLVYEIVDNSVTVSEIRSILERATVSRMTFNRLVVDGNVAVYCNLRYQAEKTLGFLNEVLDKKFSEELLKLQRAEQVLLVVEYMKTSGIVKKLADYSSVDELRQDLLQSGYDVESINTAIRKPITYLTKSHDSELKEIRDKIKELGNVNRKDYLVNLYEELKLKVADEYNSRKHSVRKSELLATPRIRKLVNSNELLISNRGMEFDNSILMFTNEGKVIPTVVSSSLRKTIKIDQDVNVVGITTDRFKYFILITDKSGAVANEFAKIRYERNLMVLDEGESVVKVVATNDETFEHEGKTYPVSHYMRSKVSKPNRSWKPLED